MIGQKFNDLTVLYRATNRGANVCYKCECLCGNTTYVLATRLRSGKTKSCGCLRSRNMRKVATKHGNSAHPLYARWCNMHARCYNPESNRFSHYGARGIVVCARWHDFAAYLEDVLPTYREGLTLDRKNNDGDYAPDNFRWASYRAQARNKTRPCVTEKEITEMRKLYLSTGLTQKDVGEAFGYCRDTVKHHLRGLRA